MKVTAMDTGFTTQTPIPLFWRADGPTEASPLLLLHGGPGAHHDYLYPQMLALAERHRVITYDQRGGGQSRTDEATPITWETQAADLSMVVREFGLDTAVGPTLVGYSWGALLAMLYAGHAAARGWPVPGRLILIAPAPITRSWRTEFETALLERGRSATIAQMRHALAASGLREQDPAAYRQRSFELSVAGYFADPTRATALTPFRVTGKVQQSVWESLGDYDLRALLRAVQIPAIVIHGREDPIPLASAEEAAACLRAPLVVLDGCGHVPYVEQPQRLFAAITHFLEHSPVP